MDVLSSVANFNTAPQSVKNTDAKGSNFKTQSSEPKTSNKEFESYMNGSSKDKGRSDAESNRANSQSKSQNQNKNYNTKSNEESDIVDKNKKKQNSDYAETGAQPLKKLNDDGVAVKTITEHINQIESKNQKQVDPLTRRSAIQAFVSKMKSSFDIEPTQILQSFSKLSVEELGLPPEQTMGKVIDHLQLQAQDQQKAQVFFTQMLNQTEASSMADYLKSSDRELSLKVLSDEQIKKQELDKSLVKLSENFFTPTESAEKVPELMEQVQKAKSPLETMQANDKLWMKDIHSNTNMPKSMQNLFEVGKDNNAFYSQNAQAADSKLSNYSAMDSQTLDEFSKNVDVIDVETVGTKPESQILDLNKLAIDRQLQAKTVVGKQDASSDMESYSNDDMSDNVEVLKSIQPNAQVKNNQNIQNIQNMIQQPQFSDLESEQNINKIIQNSQAMIKDGGGEMKIQMTPEGMGEINLKVLVEKGNVNIEMIAENKETKKLMEKGLLDLKTTLASHKLNVDGIKIDVADQLQNQMQEEFKNQERDFARQFMQDFRQSNQGFREQLFSSGPNYKSQTEDDPDNEYVRTQSSKPKTNSSRRLDLVA